MPFWTALKGVKDYLTGRNRAREAELARKAAEAERRAKAAEAEQRRREEAERKRKEEAERKRREAEEHRRAQEQQEAAVKLANLQTQTQTANRQQMLMIGGGLAVVALLFTMRK